MGDALFHQHELGFSLSHGILAMTAGVGVDFLYVTSSPANVHVGAALDLEKDIKFGQTGLYLGFDYGEIIFANDGERFGLTLGYGNI